MNFILRPWQLYVAILAGWIHRRQQEAIEYLRTENQVLRETHGSKRILLDDDQRRRLAVKAKILGRQRLEEIVDMVLRFARENVTWGYDTIQGALANLGHIISDQTVGNILKAHGVERALNRKRQTT